MPLYRVEFSVSKVETRSYYKDVEADSPLAAVNALAGLDLPADALPHGEVDVSEEVEFDRVRDPATGRVVCDA